jgi:hypothetical protein
MDIPLVLECMDPESNTYQLVKERHERECCRVGRPLGSFVVLHEGDVRVISRTTVKQRYADVFYFEKDKQRHFISRWLRDPSARKVYRVVVDPSSSSEDVVNLWRAPLARWLPPVEDEAMVAELVQPIVGHLYAVIADSCLQGLEWILDYLANMVQPKRPTRTAMCVCGEAGSGRRIVFRWFREEVLGPWCSGTGVMGETEAIGRVCIQVDGVKKGIPKRPMGLLLKPTLRWQRKYSREFEVENVSSLIVTTTQPQLPGTPYDAHVVEFRSSPLFVGNQAYFKGLGRHLERPEAARAFYQFLLRRN